jgi:ERCC4-type nuclease
MIYIDSNEDGVTDIPRKLKEIGLPVLVVPQRFDYVIDNMVGVERKEVPDYFQSKNSKEHHLNNQLVDYATNFSMVFVAIVGNDRYISKDDYIVRNNINRRNWMGGYIGTMLKTSEGGKQGDVKIAEFTCDEDFILFLMMLHEKVQQGDFIRVPKFEMAKMKNQDYAVRVLTAFPNIGEKRALEILKIHGNLQNAFTTLMYQPDQFQVKGVTDEMRNQFHKILIEKYGEKHEQ